MTPLVAHLTRGLAPLGAEIAEESAANIACAVEQGVYFDDPMLTESVWRALTTARRRGLPEPTEQQLTDAREGVIEALALWHGDWCDCLGCRASVEQRGDDAEAA